MNSIEDQVMQLIINVNCAAHQPTGNNFPLYLTEEQKQYFENKYCKDKIGENLFSLADNTWHILKYNE